VHNSVSIGVTITDVTNVGLTQFVRMYK